jgi:hypothetical protein
MFKFPAIILGGRFSPLPWQGRGLAYVIVRKSREGHNGQTLSAGSLPSVATTAWEAAADMKPHAARLTESTPLRSPPTAGEEVGRASEGQALPTAPVIGAPAPRSGTERDE